MDLSTPNRTPRKMVSLNRTRDSNDVNKPLNFTGTMSNSTTQETPTQIQVNNFGNTANAKTHFFTGTAERVLAWNRTFKHRCFFEVIASMVSIRESPDNFHNIILLRDKKGPILQVIRYFHHEMTEDQFLVGQMLRCVGYMTGINTMTAVSIRRATSEEIATLKRHCYIGDFTMSGLINAEENQN